MEAFIVLILFVFNILLLYVLYKYQLLFKMIDINSKSIEKINNSYMKLAINYELLRKKQLSIQIVYLKNNMDFYKNIIRYIKFIFLILISIFICRIIFLYYINTEMKLLFWLVLLNVMIFLTAFITVKIIQIFYKINQNIYLKLRKGSGN